MVSAAVAQADGIEAGIESPASIDDLSVASPEPVGVWRTHQEYEDLLDCEESTSQSGSFQSPSRTSLGNGNEDEVSVSAALIVRNEEQHLPGCLRSIKDLVDEIVVVDTGSTDRTPRIARDFGARVFDFPWRDDFGAPREYAVQVARGAWIFQIDADEQVRTFPRQQFRALLADSSKCGYYFAFRRRARLTRNRQLKLFRNHPGLRFVGPIHELIPPKRLRSVTGLRTAACEIEVDHLGYDGDLSQKHVRNLPLLLARLRTDPDNPDKVFIWRHLADIHDILGNDLQAECAASKAVEVLRAKHKVHPVDSAAYLGLLTWRISRGQDCAGLLDEALNLFPGNLHLLWIQGRVRMREQRYQEAIRCFQTLIESGGANRRFGDWVGCDRRLFDVFPYHSIAVCCFRMKRFAESERFFELAAACSGREQDYRGKIELCHKLSRQRR